jgi:hypothetical protein
MSDLDEGAAGKADRPRFPATLAITLVAVGTGLLIWSYMLERDNPQLLQAHPVMANLLSEAIGFCFGVVILSYLLGWLVTYFGATEKAVGRMVRHERQILDELLKNRRIFEEFMRRQSVAPKQPPDVPSQGH